MNLISKDIDAYCVNHSIGDSQILTDLYQYTYETESAPQMMCGNMVGGILQLLIQISNSKNILEIGTYTGYSALCMAEGITKNGRLHTIDSNEEVCKFARKYFKQSEYNQNIIQHNGDALEIIPRIDTEFQLVFIDADKENYYNYYNLVMEKLTLGGYIIADNVLWSGKILDSNEEDKETQALRTFNQRIHEDNRVENILLPIRDGLMLCRKLLH